MINNIALLLQAIMKGTLMVVILTCFVLDHSSASTCTPSDWTYLWTKVGTVWYTEIKEPAIWLDQVLACTKVEPGRSTIGQVFSKAEHYRIVQRFCRRSGLWIGAFRFENKWFWWNRNNTMLGQSTFFKPLSSDVTRNCASYTNVGYGGGWSNYPCNHKYSALCELRC